MQVNQRPVANTELARTAQRSRGKLALRGITTTTQLTTALTMAVATTLITLGATSNLALADPFSASGDRYIGGGDAYTVGGDPFSGAAKPSIGFDKHSEPQASEPEFLDVDQAFQLQTIAQSDGQYSLSWSIAPGYYLYEHSLKVLANGADGNQGELSEAFARSASLRKTDPYFGQVQVFYHRAELVSDPSAWPSNVQSLQIEYQGCANEGLCYPPQIRTVVYPK